MQHYNTICNPCHNLHSHVLHHTCCISSQLCIQLLYAQISDTWSISSEFLIKFFLTAFPLTFCIFSALSCCSAFLQRTNNCQFRSIFALLASPISLFRPCISWIGFHSLKVTPSCINLTNSLYSFSLHYFIESDLDSSLSDVSSFYFYLAFASPILYALFVDYR